MEGGKNAVGKPAVNLEFRREICNEILVIDPGTPSINLSVRPQRPSLFDSAPYM
jgi:hypothetical protein